MSIVKAFIKAFEKKQERGWDKIYVFVDIHETVLYPTYELNGEKRFYASALMALQEMSNWDEISLGLYTCSYPEEIEEYLIFFEENGIVFEHVNTNKDEKNSKNGYFNDKPYFNVLLDDKAGFDPEHDWYDIYKYIIAK